MRTTPLENRAEIVTPNGGMNIGENGGFQRVSGQSHVALRTFEQSNPFWPYSRIIGCATRASG
jgi:hypothetical protein